MTNIENYLSIARRQGYERVPAEFNMCPDLAKRFQAYCQETGFSFRPSVVAVPDIVPKVAKAEDFLKFFDHGFKEGTVLDPYGVAHEPGSAAAFHMRKMHFPLANFDSPEQILTYPFPDYTNADATAQRAAVQAAHKEDLVAVGDMQCTVWERAWYMRGMENLMADMMLEDPIAEALLDRVTDISVLRAESYVRSGVDVLFLGDDIGMQHTIMMSEELYCKWLQPRLARVIAAARAINPNIIVFYHSCGFVTPMIPHLIDAGIDVLNPVQPECMKFEEIHEQYGDKLSFHGTIGTQTTMPFGTPEEVKREVWKNLDIAGDRGGLFVGPTHMLEPEVPVENVVAYIEACREYSKS
ncbi:MAG: hypothetical protein J6D04_06115 [Clostridia bacterium]|nr:hypothetical protein [Clostridia bacterium]